MLFVVTDPYWQAAVKTDAELQSIVTGQEWRTIVKLGVGETIKLPRDFGNKTLVVTRTRRDK